MVGLDICTLQGASILYMLEKFLHQETLRSGLNDYLNIHKYGNAETKDLWNVLSKHANQSLDVKVHLVMHWCHIHHTYCFQVHKFIDMGKQLCM
jgi:hypothetical protein